MGSINLDKWIDNLTLVKMEYIYGPNYFNNNYKDIHTDVRKTVTKFIILPFLKHSNCLDMDFIFNNYIDNLLK